MSLINLFFSVIVILLPLAIKAQSGISVILGKKHYYIDTTTAGNYYQAAHFCAQYDMTAASIENKDEHLNLFSILTRSENIDKKFWLSGTNVGFADNAYRWLGNGKRVTYTPNTLTPSAATCLNTALTNFEYETSGCSDNCYYICEKPVEPDCGKLAQCRYTYSSNSK